MVAFYVVMVKLINCVKPRVHLPEARCDAVSFDGGLQPVSIALVSYYPNRQHWLSSLNGREVSYLIDQWCFATIKEMMLSEIT